MINEMRIWIGYHYTSWKEHGRTFARWQRNQSREIQYMYMFLYKIKLSWHVPSYAKRAYTGCGLAFYNDFYEPEQAPVPLSIFRSNSKFDENSERSSFEYTRPITTIFCTRHDSDTVVTCAKYRCDRPRIFYTRVFWIFIEFRIRSKYA